MSIAIPPVVLQACGILKKQGFQVYLVGGAIRDSLLGLKVTDWDITTDATPDQIEALFEHSLPTGKQFGTITVILDRQHLEITTMRRDGPYSDMRRPDYITFTDSLEFDLSRRDFTINAIAFDPFSGKLIDPHLGRKHLKRKILTTVGDPEERFREDPLRMLRLIRFQATLGFKIKRKTQRVLPELAELINKVSPERILAELNKMLVGKELFLGLQTFFTSGLMKEIIPELAQGQGLSPGASHRYDLLGHAMVTAHFAYPSLRLRWAALLHDIGKGDTLQREHAEISASLAKQILKRLRASNGLIEAVSILIFHHMFSVHPHSSAKELRRFLGQVGPETALELVKLRQADMAGMDVNPRQIIAFGQAMEARIKEILELDQVLSLQDLAVDGHYLMQALELKPGPIVGQILQHLLEQVWSDPTLNRPETLQKLAQNYLGSLPESPPWSSGPK
ncbi:MAG: HD domain-containing protein [Firmicutes bacterium]|nr:HD domain-containing protein [Bacillota bacterium]